MRSFNFIPNYTVSSTVVITLLISLVKMSLLSSQDSRFLGWRIFLKIRVFLRLLFFISSTSSFITATFSLIADIWFFNWSIWKSLFSILSVLFFIFNRLDSPMLIALAAVALLSQKSFFNARRCWLEKLLNFCKATFLVFVGVWWGRRRFGFRIFFRPYFVWLH